MSLAERSPVASRATPSSSASLEREWSTRSTAALLDFIVERYHAPLREALERLTALVATLRRSKEADQSRELLRLGEVFDALRTELLTHMDKEEQVLFPWIRRGEGHTAGAPIAMMLKEHRSATERLASALKLADEIECRSEDGSALPGFIFELRKLRKDLEEHMALEARVLFPRALRR